jgi:2-polyprenyl-3-methyl-5-hydroxy-6-metoxy-1,4-benzoquinol methylase
MKTLNTICAEITEQRMDINTTLRLIEGLRVMEDHSSLHRVYEALLKKHYIPNIAGHYGINLVALGKFKTAQDTVQILKNRSEQPEMCSQIDGYLDISRTLYPKSDNIPLLESAGREISGINGEPVQDILSKLQPEVGVHSEWITQKPNEANEDELKNFYAQSNAFIYDLMYMSVHFSTFDILKMVEHDLKARNVKTVLDYGGGSGTLSIYLACKGFKAHHADLKGKLLEFAKKRFAQRNLEIPTQAIEEISQDNQTNYFDAITCFEVFEHVLNPLDMMKTLHRLLKPGGTVLVSESCLADVNYATHLSSNRKYGGKDFIPSVESVGFLNEPSANDPWYKVFRKK